MYVHLSGCFMPALMNAFPPTGNSRVMKCLWERLIRTRNRFFLLFPEGRLIEIWDLMKCWLNKGDWMRLKEQSVFIVCRGAGGSVEAPRARLRSSEHTMEPQSCPQPRGRGHTLDFGAELRPSALNNNLPGSITCKRRFYHHAADPPLLCFRLRSCNF